MCHSRQKVSGNVEYREIVFFCETYQPSWVMFGPEIKMSVYNAFLTSAGELVSWRNKYRQNNDTFRFPNMNHIEIVFASTEHMAWLYNK